MITTSFTVKYYVNVLPLSMKVDAVCAKDAVEAVLAAYPNAAITAVTDTDRIVEKRCDAHVAVHRVENALQHATRERRRGKMGGQIPH